MQLTDYVNTYGTQLLRKHGQRVHKISVDAQLTCPNRNGVKGTGGCTFCNNRAFTPNSADSRQSLTEQICAGREQILKYQGSRRYMIYFQTYSNTYAESEILERAYREALATPGVVGLAIGTRPDCLNAHALTLLSELRDEGADILIELGLQTANDQTLGRINRGHTFADFAATMHRINAHRLETCAHLILGLPGEGRADYHYTLQKVISCGVGGLKLHPLHIVRHTVLAEQFLAGQVYPLTLEAYVESVVELIQHSPPELVYHRLTASARPELLIAPHWCCGRWAVINRITQSLAHSGGQGSRKNFHESTSCS